MDKNLKLNQLLKKDLILINKIPSSLIKNFTIYFKNYDLYLQNPNVLLTLSNDEDFRIILMRIKIALSLKFAFIEPKKSDYTFSIAYLIDLIKVQIKQSIIHFFSVICQNNNFNTFVIERKFFKLDDSKQNRRLMEKNKIIKEISILIDKVLNLEICKKFSIFYSKVENKTQKFNQFIFFDKYPYKNYIFFSFNFNFDEIKKYSKLKFSEIIKLFFVVLNLIIKEIEFSLLIKKMIFQEKVFENNNISTKLFSILLRKYKLVFTLSLKTFLSIFENSLFLDFFNFPQFGFIFIGLLISLKKFKKLFDKNQIQIRKYNFIYSINFDEKELKSFCEKEYLKGFLKILIEKNYLVCKRFIFEINSLFLIKCFSSVLIEICLMIENKNAENLHFDFLLELLNFIFINQKIFNLEMKTKLMEIFVNYFESQNELIGDGIKNKILEKKLFLIREREFGIAYKKHDYIKKKDFELLISNFLVK